MEQLDDFVEATQLLGFEYFAYGIEISAPFTSTRVQLLNNYSTEWQEMYLGSGFLETDPTIIHGKKTTQPIVWSEKLFKKAHPLWEEAKAHGLNHGWVQSVYSPNGTSGLITLSRSSNDITEEELRHRLPSLMWLAQITHVGLQKQLLPQLFKNINTQLTPREVEVLRWTADGKTSNLISEILMISERTVNFHLNNAARKLNASNKTSAVAIAAALGLL